MNCIIKRFEFDNSMNEDRGFKWARIDEILKNQLENIWDLHKDFVINSIFNAESYLHTDRIILGADLKSGKMLNFFRLYKNFSDEFGEGYIEGVISVFNHKIVVLKAVRGENNTLLIEFINAGCQKPLLIVEVEIK